VIDVRGVDEVDTALDRATHNAVDLALLQLADLGEWATGVAEGHGAQTQLRNQQARIAELFHTHEVVLLRLGGTSKPNALTRAPTIRLSSHPP
jgi:hypothetical protein